MRIGHVHHEVRRCEPEQRRKGTRTEADYITGCCVDHAREVGVPAPINSKIREILKQMETGAITPSPDNIALLEQAADG